MLPANSWTFDLEIVKAILGKNETLVPGVQYCGGWGDHAGMGVSVLVAQNVVNSEMRVFIGDWGPPIIGPDITNSGYYHIGDFQRLINDADLLIGHNSRGFDAKVLAAKGIILPPEKHLDFYHEVKTATRNQFPRGYGLEALSERCNGPKKSGDGALAPILWQQGRKQEVIDYCKNDIVMTTAIARFYNLNGGMVPGVTGELLRLRSPMAIALSR